MLCQPSRVVLILPLFYYKSQGRIEFTNVIMAYREGLPAVLNNVSFTIEAGCKVGICGRTGAGKSSILVALLRTADVIEGKIVIDGVDILSIGLEDLRSRIAIIPQEATLFSGVIRDNLDPLNLYTDDQLWYALEQVLIQKGVHKTSKEPVSRSTRLDSTFAFPIRNQRNVNTGELEGSRQCRTPRVASQGSRGR